MRTPARRVLLDAIFQLMPRYVDRQRASGMNCTIRWNVTAPHNGESDVYELAFVDGRCRAARRRSGSEPRLTITLTATQFLKLATGNADPMRAYFSGDVALAGDIMLAGKLASAFRIPSASRDGVTERANSA